MAKTLDETGMAILAAAGRLLADEGAGALTVRRVASEAGCSTMGLYSRFGGKDGVVEQLFRDGFEGLTEAMDSLPTDLDARSELRECGRAYRRYALGHAPHYLVMFAGAVPGFEASEESSIVAHGTFERLVARVERGQAEGCVRDDVDAEAIAFVVWATIHGFVMLELVKMGAHDQAPDEIYEMVLDQIDRGWAPLAAAPAAAAGTKTAR
jgi:AcrR family transcriptional regulator